MNHDLSVIQYNNYNNEIIKVLGLDMIVMCALSWWKSVIYPYMCVQYVCMYMYVCVLVCVHVHVYMYVCVHVHVCMCTSMRACTCMYVCTVCVHVHACVYTL